MLVVCSMLLGGGGMEGGLMVYYDCGCVGEGEGGVRN